MIRAQALPHSTCGRREGKREAGGSRSLQGKGREWGEGFWLLSQPWVWSRLESGRHMGAEATTIVTVLVPCYSGWGLISHSEVLGTGGE